MIEICNIRKVFGRKVALHNISLSVKAGEIFAFLGPNGAGKTTTIKIIAGLLRPTSGHAIIHGYNLATHGLNARALMSYVPDQPYLYEKLTAREFLHLIGDLYGISCDKLEDRIAEVAKIFELDEFIDTLTEGYSHGMKQRTVLAAALLHEPQLLVIDEPMVGLDPRSVRRVKDLLIELARNQGMTIFISTHTLSLAEEVADRVGILNNGQLVALGTLDEIKKMRASSNGSPAQQLEDVFLDLTAD
ncbi:MAG: ABC transporter ATP-binding protein [Planctomycetota bacterium]